MRRGVDMLWLVLAGGLAFFVFRLADEVRALETELEATHARILADAEAVHALRAEWSYLNRPDRLANLSARYLTLADPRPAQVRGLNDLDLGPLADSPPYDLARGLDDD